MEWLGVRLASVDDLRRRLDQTSDTLRRLQGRKSVRLALRMAELTRPVTAARRRLGTGRPRRRRALDPAAVTAAILAHRPDIGPESGPLVSMVVATRNGRPHMERLLDGLRNRTHYQLLRVGGGGQRLDRRHPRVAGRNPSLPGESGGQHRQRQLLPFLQPGRRHGDRGVRPATQQRRRPDKPGLAGSDGRHPRRGPESWRLRRPAGLPGQAGKVVAGTRPGPHGSAPRDRLRVGGSGAPPGEPGAG